MNNSLLLYMNSSINISTYPCFDKNDITRKILQISSISFVKYLIFQHFIVSFACPHTYTYETIQLLQCFHKMHSRVELIQERQEKRLRRSGEYRAEVTGSTWASHDAKTIAESMVFVCRKMQISSSFRIIYSPAKCLRGK